MSKKEKNDIILDAIKYSDVLTPDPSRKDTLIYNKKADRGKGKNKDEKEKEKEPEVETITQEINLFEKIKVVFCVHPNRRPLQLSVNILHPASFPSEVAPSPLFVSPYDPTKGVPSAFMEENIIDGNL